MDQGSKLFNPRFYINDKILYEIQEDRVDTATLSLNPLEILNSILTDIMSRTSKWLERLKVKIQANLSHGQREVQDHYSITYLKLYHVWH